MSTKATSEMLPRSCSLLARCQDFVEQESQGANSCCGSRNHDPSAQYGRLVVTADLVDAGADLEAGDLDDATPLYAAALGGHSEVVAALIKVGANVDSREGKRLDAGYSAACKWTSRCRQRATPSLESKPAVDKDDFIGGNFLTAGYCGAKW